MHAATSARRYVSCHPRAKNATGELLTCLYNAQTGDYNEVLKFQPLLKVMAMTSILMRSGSRCNVFHAGAGVIDSIAS